MSKIERYIRERIVAIWRSRTLRLVIVGALLWKIGQHFGAWSVVKPIAGQVDPIIVQSAAFKLLVMLVDFLAIQNLLAVLDNRAGVQFRKDWLPRLMEGNVAVAVYLGGRFLGTCVLVGLAS